MRLGYPDLFFNGDVEEACNSILGLWNLNYNDLRKHQEEGLVVPTIGPELYKKYETGMMRADGEPGFDTPSGKIEALSLILKRHGYTALCEYKDPIEVSPEYPLILISGSRVPCIAHSKWREDSPWLFELQRDPILTINPKDAERINLNRGDKAILKTPYGQIWNNC